MLEVAETDFLTLRFETEAEAMDKKFGSSTDPEDWRLDSIHLVRYRQTDDRENLTHYWGLGKSMLEPMRKHIAARELTNDFFHDWGVFMFCHGFVVSGAFAKGNDLGHKRAGKAGGDKVSKKLKKQWVARLLHLRMSAGRDRQRAERDVAAAIRKIIDAGGSPPDFPKNWFGDLIRKDGQLRSTYSRKHLSKERIEELAGLAAEDIPPTNFPIPTT